MPWNEIVKSFQDKWFGRIKDSTGPSKKRTGMRTPQNCHFFSALCTLSGSVPAACLISVSSRYAPRPLPETPAALDHPDRK